MKRQERVAVIAHELDRLYPDIEAPLREAEPFRLLVCVALSAQCTDRRVSETAPRLFERADTPEALARLPVAEIERIIRPCGLSRNKSRHLKAAARMLATQHEGRVPCTFAELEALPGVGHKSASVIMAQAFGKPAFPVDTHVQRLARRWKLSRGRHPLAIEKDLKKLFPPHEWHRRHLQMIYYGRAYCTARGCDGSICPLCRSLANL